MGPTSKETTPAIAPARAPHRLGRNLLIAALFVALVVAGGVWYAHQPAPVREPPDVNLTGADPEVAHAVEEAQEAVRKSPRSAKAWGELGMVLAVHSYRAPALVALAEAERLDAANPRWPYFAGLTLQPDSPKQAIPKLRRAAELSDQPAVQIRLAQVLLGEGSFDEAEALFHQAERADAGDARSALGLAQVAHAHGDPKAAQRYAREAGSDPATRKAAHALLAELYAQVPGREKDVERERRIVATLPDDGFGPDPYFQEAWARRVGKQARIDRANTLLASGHPQEALTLWRQTVEMYPDSDWVWLAFGIALSQVRDYAAAEKAFLRAVDLGPNRFESRYQLGFARYQQRGHRPDALAGAVEALRAAIRLFPTQPQAHLALGRCLREQGLWDEAAAAYGKALDCRPDSADAHRALAELLIEGGRQAVAAACLQRLLGSGETVEVAIPLQAEAAAHQRYALQFAPDGAASQQTLDGMSGAFPLAATATRP
jgi:tetratricopeptide (TPR) repeat protein